jgi:hypothetical protein
MVPAVFGVKKWKWRDVFFLNGRLLTYLSVSQILNLVSERASDPSPTRYGLKHPRKDCRGQVGDS